METTKSLTYAELAQTLGLTAGSVRNLVRRKRWPRHAGNDGATRVSVPVDYLKENTPRDAPTGGESSPPSNSPTDLPTDGDTHLAAMAMIERHVERLERELDTLKNERDAERAVALSVGAQVGALQATLAAVSAERDRLADQVKAALARSTSVPTIMATPRSWWSWRRSA